MDKQKKSSIIFIVLFILVAAVVLVWGIGSDWGKNPDITTWFNGWGTGSSAEALAYNKPVLKVDKTKVNVGDYVRLSWNKPEDVESVTLRIFHNGRLEDCIDYKGSTKLYKLDKAGEYSFTVTYWQADPETNEYMYSNLAIVKVVKKGEEPEEQPGENQQTPEEQPPEEKPAEVIKLDRPTITTSVDYSAKDFASITVTVHGDSRATVHVLHIEYTDLRGRKTDLATRNISGDKYVLSLSGNEDPLRDASGTYRFEVYSSDETGRFADSRTSNVIDERINFKQLLTPILDYDVEVTEDMRRACIALYLKGDSRATCYEITTFWLNPYNNKVIELDKTEHYDISRTEWYYDLDMSDVEGGTDRDGLFGFHVICHDDTGVWADSEQDWVEIYIDLKDTLCLKLNID